jgi:predicted branched-subunit amino acid permease
MSVESLTRVPPPARTDPAQERREGIRAMASILLAFAPFAIAVGTAITQSENRLAAWLGTSTIYGGAAHLAVLDLLSDGAGWVAAAGVALLVNVRLAAFSTSMVPDWRSAPLRQRLLAAVMLTDGPWAMSRNRPGQRHFYLGAAATLFLAWPVMVTIGMLLGQWLSAWAVTAILPPLSLAALVAPRLRVRPVAVAAAAAVVTALATLDLPAGTSLVICAVVGTVAAAVTKALSSSLSNTLPNAPTPGSPS